MPISKLLILFVAGEVEIEDNPTVRQIFDVGYAFKFSTSFLQMLGV
jgi:hypothetical protein